MSIISFITQVISGRFEPVANTKRAKQPHIIYKYYPSQRVSFFDEGMVRFSQFMALNDPLDFGVMSDDEVVAGVKFIRSKLIMLIWITFGIGIPVRLTKELFKNTELKENHKRWARALAIFYVVSKYAVKTYSLLTEFTGENSEAIIKMNKDLADIMRHKVYDGHLLVFSCSRRPDSIPMWAHYAGNHQGFQIGFVPDDAFEWPDPTGHMFRPTSTKMRYLKKLRYGGRGWKALRDVSSIKHKDWSYEEEWRFVAIPQNLALPTASDCSGLPIFLAQMNPLSLREITFGHRSTPELRREIVEKCSSFCPQVEFYEIGPWGLRRKLSASDLQEISFNRRVSTALQALPQA